MIVTKRLVALCEKQNDYTVLFSLCIGIPYVL